jgi:endonuclease YncB( thermonuclease family)
METAAKLAIALPVALALVMLGAKALRWDSPSAPTTASTSPVVPSGGPRTEIVGRASVLDGDTIEIHGERIRIHGIDAPERGQRCNDVSGASYRCGQRAALVLNNLLGSGTVRCVVSGMDRYGRALATCRKGSVDLGAYLVERGWAVAYRKYSLDYVSAESQAKAARKGVWAGSFVPPSEYRELRREGVSEQR